MASANRTTAADSDEDEDEESLAKFPLGKKYPFTFKLMVHKLYRVDEMLEKSKMEFKPLAEQDAVVEQDKAEEEQDKMCLRCIRRKTRSISKLGVVVMVDGEEVSLVANNAVYLSLFWDRKQLDLPRLYSSRLALEDRASSKV